MSFNQQYEMGGATITVFGQQPRIINNPAVSYQQALSLGASRGAISQLVVAAGEGVRGHKLVVPAPNQEEYADGLILRESGQGAAFQTADCAAIFAYDHSTGKVGVGHGGRPAMTPPVEQRMCTGCTIVGNLLCFMQSPDLRAIEVLITGNICGSCFVHERPEDEEKYLQWFRGIPDAIGKDFLGRLDLYRVIEHHFIHAGVPKENIRHEGPCTKETLGLASHRRGDVTRNTFIVVKH